MIQAGQRLGPYEILAPIGAGGMGEVWKARDTRLDRPVAIKVLPDALATSPRLHVRFDREARAISALNHPHICTLHDVGRESGTSFLVMEYLEGESLAERLRRGPLPLEEVLRYGRQIALALDAAHRSGIVHRDLKPGNVMLTRSGAKLLDFGLARTGGPLAMDSQLPEAATENKPLTAEGTIVGTFQYMAPEQLEGLEADPRTDIFAFGVMLYEMATGRRAFQGTSRTSLIAAIVASQPQSISALAPATPPAVDHVVRRCLEKKPEDRWQSAHDIAAELEWIAESGSATGDARTAPLWRRLLLAAAIVALAVTAVLWLTGRPSDTARHVVKSAIPLASGTALAGWGPPAIALSPDGRTIAYVASDGTAQRLYVRPLDSEKAIVIEGSDSAEGPFFSPDGKFIAFAVGVSSLPGNHPAELRRVPVSGGLSQTLTALEDFFGGVWSSDGNLYFVQLSSRGLFRVPASGGTPQRVGGAGHFRFVSSLLPDGSGVITSVTLAEQRPRLSLVDTESGAVVDMGIDGTAGFVSGDRLFYVSPERKLFVTGFDPKRRVASAAGSAVLEDLAVTGTGYPVIALSNDGTLLYGRGFVGRSEREWSRVVRIDRTGQLHETPLQPDSYNRRGIGVSPDGLRVAVSSWPADLWIGELRRGTRLRLPQKGAAQRVNMTWSPDGETIAFSLFGGEAVQMGIAAADGSGRESMLTDSFARPFEAYPAGWLDRETLLFSHISDEGTSIRTLRISDPKSHRAVLQQPDGFLRVPAVSPDGRWIAYTARVNERSELIARRIDGKGVPVVVAPGGDRPLWRAGGTELLFRDGDRLMVVGLTGTDDPEPGTPRELVTVPGLGSYAAVPGTDDILAIVTDPVANRLETLILVQNWFAEADAHGPAGAGR